MEREEREIFEPLYFGASKPTVNEMKQLNEIYSQLYEDESDEDDCFSGEKGRDNYLLIVHNGEVVGTVLHVFNKAKVDNFVFDIWMRSTRFTGKGLGTQALMLITDCLRREYAVDTFIIRPCKANLAAIRCYEKSGFVAVNNFDASLYYDDETVAECGDGDYGIEDTYNMIKTYGGTIK